MTALTSEQLLTSLAILKANWNDGRRSYLDSFVPFLADAMLRRHQHAYDASQLAAALREDFGMEVPAAAVGTLLTRAARSKLGIRSYGKFSPDYNAIKTFDLTDVRARTSRELRALVEAFRTFAQREHESNLTAADAEGALAAYIAEHSVALLRAHRFDTPLEVSLPLDANEYLVGSFVLWIYTHDPDLCDYMDTLVKGSMLASTLYFPHAADPRSRFDRLTAYLDTPVLLSVLGYQGPEGEAAAKAVLDSAYVLGARLACFEDSVNETRNVLMSAAAALRRPLPGRYAPSRVETFFQKIHYKPADVEVLIEQLDDDLRARHISVLARPDRTHTITLDEPELERVLGECVQYRNPGSLRHDLDALAAINELRDGQSQTRLESARAVFVTSNKQVVRASGIFFSNLYGASTWPPAILDDDFGTLVWLKAPLRYPDLPRLQIIADSYAATQPGPQMWDAYLAEIEALQARGDVTEDQFFSLRYSLAARQALMRLTRGEAETVTGETVRQVLERTEKELQQPILEQLRDAQEAATARSADAAERMRALELRAERAERDAQAARDVADALRAAIEKRARAARRRANTMATGIARAIAACMTAIFVLSVWLSLPDSIGHAPLDIHDVARPLATALGALGGGLAVMHFIFGRSLVEMSRSLRLWLEAQIYRRITRDDEQIGQVQRDDPT
jgi:hypothetical protein